MPTGTIRSQITHSPDHTHRYRWWAYRGTVVVAPTGDLRVVRVRYPPARWHHRQIALITPEPFR